jgi:putative hemolysin
MNIMRMLAAALILFLIMGIGAGTEYNLSQSPLPEAMPTQMEPAPTQAPIGSEFQTPIGPGSQAQIWPGGQTPTESPTPIWPGSEAPIEPGNSSSQASSPSKIYCTNQGYSYQNGKCVFPDGSSCEAGAFSRGECSYNSGSNQHVIGMANPASVNCVNNGGKVDIRHDLSGNEIGYCILPDGSECDEWAFYNGECKGSGPDHESKIFTIWIGDVHSKNLPSAEVFIDGNRVGVTNSKGEVRAGVNFGQHTVSAKASCGDASKDYDFTPNISGVTLTIDSCGGGTPGNSKIFTIWVGDVHSKNLPGAEVFIDGNSVGVTNSKGEVCTEVNFGHHTVSAKANCGEASKDYDFSNSIDGVTLTIDSCPAEQIKTYKIWVGDKNSKNLPGAEVFIDGNSVGVTDSKGEVQTKVNFGQHTVSAKASCGDASKDYDFAQDINGVTLTIDSCPGGRMPDLVVSRLSFSKNPCHLGDDVEITFWVVNQGDRFSDGCTACLMIDGQKVSDFTVPDGFKLEVGKSVVWSYTYKVNQATPNPHNVRVCADCANIISEKDESNNCIEDLLKVECPTTEEIRQLINGWKEGTISLNTVIDAITEWAQCNKIQNVDPGSIEQQRQQMMSLLQTNGNSVRGNESLS